MSRWLLPILIVCSVSFASRAGKKTYTVGTQSINYKPHYNFSSQAIDSYAEDVLKLFAAELKIQFIFVPLTIKRLNVEANVDFIYPDSPLWRKAQNRQSELLFSKPLIHILGSTMVLASREHMQLDELKTVALPRGFTPEHLLKAQAMYRFEFVETSNAESALKMVLKGRVDAADVELNVANFLLKQLNQPGALVPASALPSSRVGFHLSTAKHPDVIVKFDHFLMSHRDEIEDLKKKYELQETFSKNR